MVIPLNPIPEVNPDPGTSTDPSTDPDADTAKLLSLQYGGIPVLVDELKTFDKIVEHARKLTKEMLPMEKGDYYIITGGYPFKEVKHTNFMKIEEI